MNVYDFDGTIYRGDSSVDFFVYAAVRHPVLFLSLPRQASYIVMYLRGKLTRTEWKKLFFAFLAKVPDADELAETFCRKKIRKIRTWYLSQKKDDDIIISASPDFIISRFGAQLGVRTIASVIDTKDGTLIGENCRGAEKINRLYAEYGKVHIDNFYSDSNSDLPLAELADKAYKIKRGVPGKWT